MNQAWLHLITNHIPVIALPIVAIALAWGLARRHDAVMRLALAGAVLLGPITAFVVWSGEGAEEVVEDEPWASRQRIHDHEDWGDRARIVALLTAVGAGAVLVMSRGLAVHRAGTTAVLVGLIASSAVVGYTALEGGEIRHDEVHGLAPDAGQPRP